MRSGEIPAFVFALAFLVVIPEGNLLLHLLLDFTLYSLQLPTGTLPGIAIFAANPLASAEHGSKISAGCDVSLRGFSDPHAATCTGYSASSSGVSHRA